MVLASWELAPFVLLGFSLSLARLYGVLHTLDTFTDNMSKRFINKYGKLDWCKQDPEAMHNTRSHRLHQWRAEEQQRVTGRINPLAKKWIGRALASESSGKHGKQSITAACSRSGSMDVTGQACSSSNQLSSR